ncbi:hypothetical protein [Sunxiuqinia dokdonensis]|nr:hypothetical protein [Sunxiuqinia dokdonensis]
MSSTIDKRIRTLFPDAAPFEQVLEGYFQLMTQAHGLDVDQTIAAVSLCPDELNNPVIEKIRELFGHVFHLGGLTGYPFTGETGFNAFGDHIPDAGTAFIFFGPHLGITENSLGYVHRPGQARDTLSCGAAFGAYQMLLNGQQLGTEQQADDYQQTRVRQMLAPKLDTIPRHQPELALLNILFEESHAFVVSQSTRIKERFQAEQIILLGAMILNTPLDMPDYLQVKYFEAL